MNFLMWCLVLAVMLAIGSLLLSFGLTIIMFIFTGIVMAVQFIYESIKNAVTKEEV